MKALPRFAIALLPVLLLSSAFGQTFYPRTDTFVFVPAGGAITSWDGSDPANPPYPSAMGYVELGNNASSGIGIPWQLGYLNNGELVPCNPLAWGQKVWQKRSDGTVGDGTQAGDTYVQPATTLCPYFTGEYGTAGNSWNILDGFNVLVTYTYEPHRQSCRFCPGGYKIVLIPVEQGGTGVAQQTEINPQ